MDSPEYHTHSQVLKEIAKYAWKLSNLVAILRLNLFVKIDLQQWLNKLFDQLPNHKKNQGDLFT